MHIFKTNYDKILKYLSLTYLKVDVEMSLKINSKSLDKLTQP